MKGKGLLSCLCVGFLAIGGWLGWQMYDTWQEYRAGEEAYTELAQYISVTEPARAETVPEETEAPPEQTEDAADAGETVPEETQPQIQWPEVDFEALLAINPDVVAWIYVEGTSINYPVVQGTDNRYYLSHLVDGTPNGAGTIFLDYRNGRDLSDRNSVLYGHHMKNGSMFNHITRYKSQSFYEAHPMGLVMTPEGNYTLEFFAGYVTDMNSDAWKMEFGSEEEYTQWLERAVDKSAFKTDVTPGAGDRVMTLSTCTYEYNDARFVLVGILKE